MDLEDFIGPNFVMVNRCREDLYDLLSLKKINLIIIENSKKIILNLKRGDF